MATVINNPGETTDNGGGMGYFMGMLLLVVVVVLFLIYGLPMLRGGSTTSTAPQGGTQQTQPQINIPDKVDVNVKTPTSK